MCFTAKSRAVKLSAMEDAAAEPTATAHAVTRLLQDWGGGDAGAQADLMALVYDELRRLARSHLRGERADHTLQPTALVHEAYLRMMDQRQRVSWQNRAHFYGVAGEAMRRILIDYAREHKAAKRGGGVQPISLDEVEVPLGETSDGLLALDDALQNFARLYPRHCQVVKLKFFAGLEMPEIAELLQVSERTVFREWNAAKLWLCRELGVGAAP